MELPAFTGADAPLANFDGDVLVLRYNSLADYESRVHEDHAAIAAAPGVRIVSSWRPHTAAHLSHVVLVFALVEAPIVAAPVQSSRKSR